MFRGQLAPTLMSWARCLRSTPRLPALGSDGWLALALIALGAFIRLGLILLSWPATDSDEATMGLMALHINAGHDWPLFFYGQSYMGTLQAYLGAVLFNLFGASVVSLRLGLLLLFVLFLVVMYRLLKALYPGSFALVGLFMLDLGGPDLLKPQLLALGGYPETLLFGALSLLLAFRLARGTKVASNRRPGWRRLLAYALLGLVMGVGFWSDALILPMLLVSVAMLALFCWRELRWRGLGALIAGFIVGQAPQILFLITQPTASGPSTAAAFKWQGLSTITQFFTQFGGRFLGALLVALPNISGAGWVCAAPTLPNGALAAPFSAPALGCLGLRAVWSLGLLALGAFAAHTAWQSLRACGSLRLLAEAAPQTRAAATQACGRLALLLGGALTLTLYLLSPTSFTPAGNARYLIEVAIALPAALFPLWTVGEALATRGWVGAHWLRWGALALIALTLCGGVLACYAASGKTRAEYAADQRLVADLERLGVRHMHTDYWTCDKVIFLSRERIICDALKTNLAEGDNRYPAYVALVAADPHAAYVFPERLPQAQALSGIAQGGAWTVARLDGYVVYQPR